MDALLLILIPLLLSLTSIHKSLTKFGSILLLFLPFLPLHSSQLFFDDEITRLFLFISSFLGGLILLYGTEHVTYRPKIFRGLMFLFVGCMNGLVLVRNLWLFFFFWECTTIFSYLLIAHKIERKAAKKAARKAIIINQFGGILLFTAFLILHFLGISTLSQLASSHHTILFIPFILIVIAAMTKSAIYPFHYWLPDAMEAPVPVSALLHSAAMVKAGLYLFFRISPLFSFFFPYTLPFLLLFGFSLIYSSALAFVEKDAKRILAYSTIGNISIIAITCLLATPGALLGGLYHTLNHSIFKALLFLSIGLLIKTYHTRSIIRMRFLPLFPLFEFFFIIGLLSAAGLPPFNGFLSKWFIYESTSNHILAILFIIFGSVLMVGYYLRFLAVLHIKGKKPTFYNPTKSEIIPIVIFSSLCVIFGVLPFNILSLIYPARDNIIKGIAENYPLTVSFLFMLLIFIIYLIVTKLKFRATHPFVGGERLKPERYRYYLHYVTSILENPLKRLIKVVEIVKPLHNFAEEFEEMMHSLAVFNRRAIKDFIPWCAFMFVILWFIVVML